MCSEPILRQPNFQLPFIIFTDASALAAGAILSQTDNDGEYVVSFGSKNFKIANYITQLPKKNVWQYFWLLNYT